MNAHGEEGHIVNTASVNGVAGAPLAGPYSATKFAVVGMSEVLAAELADTPIGVSVLCPSWVPDARQWPQPPGSFRRADKTRR